MKGATFEVNRNKKLSGKGLSIALRIKNEEWHRDEILLKDVAKQCGASLSHYDKEQYHSAVLLWHRISDLTRITNWRGVSRCTFLIEENEVLGKLTVPEFSPTAFNYGEEIIYSILLIFASIMPH